MNLKQFAFSIGLFLTANIISLPAVFSQSTAPSVITNDCDGNSHDLYSKLNAGKIIVIGWAMPCGTCAPPMLSVHNAVLNFAVSNPNTVEFWLADDYADTPCGTLEGWAAANGITYATFFSTTDLDMLDFGSTGMPKAVVIGCTDGTVFYNVDDNPTGAGVTTAINTILNGGCTNSVFENENENGILEIYPNPGNSNFTLIVPAETENETVNTEVYSLTGKMVYSNSFLYSGSSGITIDLNQLTSSVYFVMLKSESGKVYQAKIFID